MRPIDPQLDPWLTGMVLPWRSERLSTVMGDGSRQPYFWYDYTSPTLRDGVVVDNGCPFPRSGFVSDAAGYEWSDWHQGRFEEVVAPHLDLVRWDGVVAELRSHWVNASDAWGTDEVAWMAALAPGVRPLLHELGKTKEFRSLRRYYFDDSEGPTFRAVTLDDPRLEDATAEPSAYRAQLIASRGMVEWYSKRYDDQPWTVQTCAFCGDDFWPNLLDSTGIQRMGLPRYCAPCVRMTATDVWSLGHINGDLLKPMLVTIAQKFYELTGVFPYQNIKRTPIGALTDQERDTWMGLYMLVPRPDTVQQLFGSWREYLHAAGMLEGSPRRGHSGYVTVANDGHVALSVGERLVCDWLHRNGVAHEKEPVYPTHPELNPAGKLRADWLIGDCWVELAGRMPDPKYAQKMATKQELAQACGLRHLVLLPAEVRRLEPIAAEHWGWAAHPADSEPHGVDC